MLSGIIDDEFDDDVDDDVTPPRSPLVVQSSKPLLLRPADNSPFTTAHYGLSLAAAGNLCNQSNGASSNNSTPYSQISVPSSYDYEDDFTSESDSEIPAYLPTAQGPLPSALAANSLPLASSDKRYPFFFGSLVHPIGTKLNYFY